MKKYLFPFLIALAALMLAGAAAFFSVTGLSKLFGGAKVEVIVMASALEFAKIITASFLHRYWTELKWQLKTYLTIGVITVMIITSAGIYGFLSNAYATTSGKLSNIDAQVQMVDQKKTILSSEIARVEENKKMKGDRIKSLVTLRAQQESRVDSLYNRRQTAAAKRVEEQIVTANQEIVATNIEIDTLNNQVQRKYNTISAMDLEILNLKNNDVNGEVGPLKYIAQLTGKNMDSVVNFFILLLIFVFDPLAVALVIATNIAFEKELGKKNLGDLLKKETKDMNESREYENYGHAQVDNLLQNPSIEAEPIDNSKKTEEVINYMADDEGNFKPVAEPVVEPASEPIVEEPAADVVESQKLILDAIKAQGIEHNASYLNFLEVLFNDGKATVGDLIPSWKDLLIRIKDGGFKFTEKEVKSFLTICNLFKIIDMTNKRKSTIAKDYTVSKQIISLLSK